MLTDKGVYLLIIKVCCQMEISVGALGTYKFTPGLYIYVGSALGSGGLRARVCRHIRKNKKIKWHIDYLTSSENTEILEVLFLQTKERREEWLAEFVSQHAKPYIKGFGSSDTTSYSHLFKISETVLSTIRRKLLSMGFKTVTRDELDSICISE